jgi:hypothetical protein
MRRSAHPARAGRAGAGRLGAAQSLLSEADALAGTTGLARARVSLEGGRVARRLQGDAAAIPLLAQAYDEALAAGQYFIAADAAHSCALDEHTFPS